MPRPTPRSVRSAALALSVAVGLSGLAACGSGSTGGASGDPVPGGTLNVLRDTPFEGFELDKESLNATFQLSQAVLEPLLRAGADGTSVEAGLAQKWTFNRANTQLTIDLDPAATFSDGRPVTPEDVAFSVDTWKAGANYGVVYAVIKGTKKIDEDTVRLDLAYPYSALPNFLASPIAGIVPADFGGRKAAAFWQQPVGAGPYAVTGWSANGKVELARNEHYHREGRPYLDKVVSTFASDANSIALQLQSAQADLADSIGPVTASQLPKGQVAQGLEHFTYNLLVNSADPALEDVKVRQAFARALDYDGIVKGALKGYGQAPTGVLPINTANWAPPSTAYFSQDTQQAKDLAAGADLPERLSLVYINDPTFALIAQIVQDNLEDLGVEVELEAADAGSAYGTMAGGDYQLGLFAYNAIAPDVSEPMGYLAATGTMFTGGPVDALNTALADYSATEDPAAKQAVVTRAQDALLESATLIALAHAPVLEGRRDVVGGVEQAPWGTYYLDEVWKSS